MAKGAKPEPDKYHTLGQFYDAIKQGWLDSSLQVMFVDCESNRSTIFRLPRQDFVSS